MQEKTKNLAEGSIGHLWTRAPERYRMQLSRKGPGGRLQGCCSPRGVQPCSSHPLPMSGLADKVPVAFAAIRTVLRPVKSGHLSGPSVR